MARDLGSKCKKCRRAGEKIFLKGDRCDSPKCAMVKKAYPPGIHAKVAMKGLSEYGKQLAVKQKTKRTYGVLERQFRKHFEEIKNKPGVTGDLLLGRLEMRLDNVVYRMGIASSRSQARQLVRHGFFKVNNKKTDIPSYEVKVGSVVSLNEIKKDKNYLKEQIQVLKNKKNFPSWIRVDTNKLQAEILAKPSRKDMDIRLDFQAVVEFYSR